MNGAGSFLESLPQHCFRAFTALATMQGMLMGAAMKPITRQQENRLRDLLYGEEAAVRAARARDAEERNIKSSELATPVWAEGAKGMRRRLVALSERRSGLEKRADVEEVRIFLLVYAMRDAQSSYGPALR